MANGAVMGVFSGLGPGRQLQIIYSAVKVPILLLATFTVCLPSFFVLNTLFGLRRDFPVVTRSLLATQGGLAVILASLAPFTAVWYASSANYQHAILFNAFVFAAASVSGQWILQAYYRPLIIKNKRHQWLMWTWIGIYALVGIQMGWVLRPFIGSPNAPVQFLRTEPWDNAYVVVFQLIWRAFQQFRWHWALPCSLLRPDTR